MKKLLGFGLVAIAGAVSLTALLAQAAVGDAIYVTGRQSASLDTAAKRNAMRDLVRELAPGIALASVESVECYQTKRGSSPAIIELRNNWLCQAERTDSRTDADLLDAVLTGTVRRVSGDGKQRLGPVNASGSVTQIDGVTELAFSLDVANVAHFECERQEVGDPTCYFYEIKTDTPANWKADMDAGNVAGTIGKVQ